MLVLPARLPACLPGASWRHPGAETRQKPRRVSKDEIPSEESRRGIQEMNLREESKRAIQERILAEE